MRVVAEACRLVNAPTADGVGSVAIGDSYELQHPFDGRMVAGAFKDNAKIGYEQLTRWAEARVRGRATWVSRRGFGGGTT